MRLVFDGERFLFLCSFQERNIPRDAGFKWRDDIKWFTDNAAVAGKLCEYATDAAKRELDRVLIKVSPWLKPLPLPPPGLELLPHQVDATIFALSRNRSYLGLDPGLGKTIVAATIARALGGVVVYISPAFLVQNIEEEFRKWAPEVRLLVVPDSRLADEETFCRVILRGADSSATLIVDEAHRFKNLDARRTSLLFGNKSEPGICEYFSRQIFMSGTPMPNRPIELYPVLSNAAPETIDFMGAFDFGRRYCAGHRTRYGWDFSGASNLHELRESVIHPGGKFMLRLKKSLLKLPPKTEEVFVVADSMGPRLAKMEKGLGAAYATVEDLIKAQIATKEGKQPEELHVGTYRRLLGMEKIAPAVEYIESILDESDDSLLVFAYHREVIAGLSKRLIGFKPYIITGDTPVGERHEMVKDFQKSKTRRLMIGNYLSMGIGFTLTKATQGLFVEYSWVPGENEQAGDRMHRIGQKGTVLIQYMVYKNSIDKAVIETLLKKRKILNYI